MKRMLVISFVLGTATFLLAAEPSVFELHAVADGPADGTKVYELPRRDGKTESVNLEAAVLLDDSALKSVEVTHRGDAQPGLLISFTESGRTRFGEITGHSLGKRLGIVVAGKLLVAPVVKEPILGGAVELNGSLTEESAGDLASKLNEIISRNSASPKVTVPEH